MQSAMLFLKQNFANKVVYFGSITGLIIASLAFISPSQAQSAVRDCDDNAVLRCGAYSFNELNNKYQNQAGARQIFAYYGIGSNDVRNMSSHAVNGSVTKQGGVYVNGRLVATNAQSTGRQFIPGSTRITSGGVTFYQRPTSVSFVSSPLDAFVVMRNGQFQYAVLKSCGNPVVAHPRPTPTPTSTPTTKPTPTPTPSPKPTPTPTVKPTPTCPFICPTPTPTITPTPSPTPTPCEEVCPTPSPTPTPIITPTPCLEECRPPTQSQSQTQSQSVTINNITSPPTPPSATTAVIPQDVTTTAPVESKEVPVEIPNTGNNDKQVFGVFLGATSLGTLLYQIVLRRRL